MSVSNLISENAVQVVLVIIVVVLLGYLAMNYLKSSPKPTPTAHSMKQEHFYGAGDTTMVPTMAPTMASTMTPNGQQMMVSPEEMQVMASEGIMRNERPKPIDTNEGTQLNQLPAECYPKDVLSSADLLPRDADSLWAQVAPSGQGSLQDKNFLTAGFHVGINTVGQTLRNANWQLRSDPPNPQVKVSPWNQTTIESDTNRRPLEIGGSY